MCRAGANASTDGTPVGWLDWGVQEPPEEENVQPRDSLVG